MREKTSLYTIYVPKEIIMDKSLGNKRVIVYLYLYENMTRRGFVKWSINELVTWCGYKPESKKGGMNHQFIDCLQKFADLGYITSHPDFESLKSEPKNGNTFQRMELDKNKMKHHLHFGKIMSDEVDMILNYKSLFTSAFADEGSMTGKIFPSHLSLVLSYIMCNINFTPGKPRCCFRLYKTMVKDLGISKTYIKRCVEILQGIGIIRYKVMDQIKNPYGTFSSHIKVFANTRLFECGYLVTDYNVNAEMLEQMKLIYKYYENLRTDLKKKKDYAFDDIMTAGADTDTDTTIAAVGNDTDNVNTNKEGYSEEVDAVFDFDDDGIWD